MRSLRKKIVREEFDYQTLSAALGSYSCPRDKITSLLKNGIILRIRKGLYVFGDDQRRHPFSLELLANLVYGPSYLSLDYALAYYSFIPERCEVLTSVCLGRSREFHTAIGTFSYHRVATKGFSLGVDRVESGENAFLIATREKAVVDKLVTGRTGTFGNRAELLAYLTEDLRMEHSDLAALEISAIKRMAEAYGSRKVRMLGSLVGHLRRRRIV